MKREGSQKNSRNGPSLQRPRQNILPGVQWLGHVFSKDTALGESNDKLPQVKCQRNLEMKANSKKIVMRLDGETPKLGRSPMCIGKEPDADGSISSADEGKKPECAELRKNRSTWLKKNIR